MDVQKTLADFKARIDPKIAAYLDARIAEAKDEDSLVAEALEHVKELTLAGGKRLRPAFMHYGYVAASGEDRARLLDAAVAVELIHMFLLVHDDIIDRDDRRHGVPTLHDRYATWGKRHLNLSNPRHFGDSIALIVGDMLFAFGNDVIFRSGFPPERILAVLSAMQTVVSRTVIGQARDVYMEYRGEATEAEILKMYENKSARYTIEGPLHMGAILAGGDQSLLEAFSQYALPLGVAFQIQDDVLGVFGSTERTGKPVGSDIEEGKMTLLVTRALDLLSRDEKKELRRILKIGQDLASDDIVRFRVLIEKSGALAQTKAVAAQYVKQGLKALQTSQAMMAPEAYDFLSSAGRYLAEREY